MDNSNAETANNNKNNELGEDEHEQDTVMPGFRFHPTEEELVEFYLRRKVDGKKFNVELITFLDLYRYDPWELPAMAAIGEKEWYFYVPRDRKYRNGDRPNRVTTSGYWKATGADRSIRASDNAARPIGLKKTLVFYTGKAPKGIRTSWIMNEYRLPQHDSTHKHQNQKAEISLCRVHKRAGVEDHTSIPRAKSKNIASSSSSKTPATNQKTSETAATITETSSSTNIALGGLSGNYTTMSPPVSMMSNQLADVHLPMMNPPNSVMINSNPPVVDDLHRLVSFRNQHPFFSGFLYPLSETPPSPLPPFTDRLWEWNAVVSSEPHQPPSNFNSQFE